MGLLIRDAVAADYATFARLFPELETGDPIPDEARFTSELMATTIIAEEGGAALGVLVYVVLTGVAHVRIIVVDPSARRRGIGRALMREAAERFRAAKCAAWCLNTFPHNAKAIALYESLGLRRVYISKALRLPWSIVDARRASGGSAGFRARPVEPADDERVEAATSLLPGQLADGRANGRVLRQLEDDTGAVVGAAIFDPKFPGAYPFRVVRPELAWPLLAALRPDARPEDTIVNLVIEGQPEVADELLASGATLRLETQHMRGPLAAA